MKEARRLIPQFWAYAQVLSRAWYVYTDSLHESEDELNQMVSSQIHDVCQMIKTAGERGMIDEDRVVDETLTAIHRAGADLILTYFAESAARRAAWS